MRATVLDVVRDVVDQQAPGERPLVDDLAGLNYRLVVRRMRQANDGRGGDPLGFGLSEVTALITPVVLLAVHEACRAAVADVTGRLLPRVTNALDRLRPPSRRPTAPPEVPDLDRDQLAAVRRRVRTEAVRRGLPEPDAEALADSVVARLALAGTERAEQAT
ncbi:hypothetical protein ETD83_12740 [Actinomadura soli]|uniref:Uncharacterized protein n=1 Tax=Actinomadura soli TaxID=2508997 RepID=A0A5C4JED8_9ACTN|nr:hypothetical protein [Actinomadura soli]TMR02404.1 hypothetical protein ETD83_12740 [Actinomadura soli]